MSGASKYDDLTRAIQADTGAEVVLVLIIGGKAGGGCCHAVDAGAERGLAELNTETVRRLRHLADSIERGNVPGRLVPKSRPS